MRGLWIRFTCNVHVHLYWGLWPSSIARRMRTSYSISNLGSAVSVDLLLAAIVFSRLFLTLSKISVCKSFKNVCTALMLINFYLLLPNIATALIFSLWLDMIRVIERVIFIQIRSNRCRGGVQSSSEPSLSNSKALLIVGVAVITSFQCCRTNVNLSIMELSAASTVRISDSTIPSSCCEYATVGLCRIRTSLAQISIVQLRKWGP